jgi:hypothetical protein
MKSNQTVDMASVRESVVSKHLEEIAWGMLLILTGVIWIVPGNPVPFGTWLIGTGIILVGINAVRYSLDRRFETFSVVLGIVALVAGVGEVLAVDVPILGLCLVAFGAVLLLRPLRRIRSAPRTPA